jgi:negative regulator of sigma E activity
MASRLEIENKLRDIQELLEEIERNPTLSESNDAVLKHIHAQAKTLSQGIRDVVYMIHAHWRQN